MLFVIGSPLDTEYGLGSAMLTVIYPELWMGIQHTDRV